MRSVWRMEKSGSGRSRLAAQAGLPVLRLDDFYRDGADPFVVRRWLVLLRDQALAPIAALHRG